MAFGPENNMNANPAENKLSADPLAIYKERVRAAAENEKTKKDVLFASKGYELINTDFAKIEIPDLGKQILDEIEDVKKRFRERETNRGNYGKLREISMHDSRWLSNTADFIKENGDNADIIKKFWREFEMKFKNLVNEEGNNVGKVYKNSILGTIATEKVLEEDFGLKIDPGDQKKDIDYKIDATAITKDKDGRNVFIAMQYFSNNWEGLLTEDKIFLSENGMVQFFSEDDLNKEWHSHAQTIFAKVMEEKIQKTKNGCMEYIRDHEREIGDAKFMLMFATMPVGAEHNRPIVDETGELVNKNKKEHFCRQFKDEFDEKVNGKKFLNR